MNDETDNTALAVTGASMQLTRLLQLASPTLPIGAFAWSEGLEKAVEAQWVIDEDTAREWILGVLAHCASRVDVPLFKRLHAAWQCGDEMRVREHSGWLLACRESAELRAGDRALGGALARVLDDLGESRAARWRRDSDVTFAAMFALAAVHWRIPCALAATALLWTWCENLVSVAVKIVPLGHSAGQRVLLEAGSLIPDLAAAGLALDDDAIGGGAPGLALVSALHETQRTRLFRS